MKADQNFANDDSDVFLLETSVWRSLHQGKHASTLGVFHGNPNARTVEKASVVLGDVGRIAKLSEEGNFSLNVANVVVCRVEVDDFESDDIPGRNVETFVDRTIRTLPNRLQTLVEEVDRWLGH
jgi:hypothetical protein